MKDFSLKSWIKYTSSGSSAYLGILTKSTLELMSLGSGSTYAVKPHKVRSDEAIARSSIIPKGTFVGDIAFSGATCSYPFILKNLRRIMPHIKEI